MFAVEAGHAVLSDEETDLEVGATVRIEDVQVCLGGMYEGTMESTRVQGFNR